MGPHLVELLFPRLGVDGERERTGDARSAATTSSTAMNFPNIVSPSLSSASRPT